MIGPSRFTSSLIIIVIQFSLFLSIAKAESAFPCDVQSVTSEPFGTGIQGQAILCNTSAGLATLMRTKQLVPGDAYTAWWVYFDDPSACVVPNRCGLADFAGDNPLGVFGRMDSTIAPNSGNSHFSGTMREFNPSSGSEVRLLIIGHSAANNNDKRHLARQLLTPELPSLGKPHIGNDIDGALGFAAAMAIFSIP